MNSYEKIGSFCRLYRIVDLDLPLKEVAKDDSIQLLSSFEHGKSTNIKHLFKYIEACETKEQKMKFLSRLLDYLEGEKYE